MNSEAETSAAKTKPASTSRGRREAADLLATAGGMFLFAALWAAIIHYNGLQNGPVAWALFALFMIIYLPLTHVALRASRFHGALRYCFCITAAPVYIALFIGAMTWLLDQFPALDEHLARSLARGGRRAGMTQGILIGLLSAIAFWIWYRIMRWLDSAVYPPEAAGEAQTFQPSAPMDEASPRR